jgi:DNA-binding MarR family transcriptional regulator
MEHPFTDGSEIHRHFQAFMQQSLRGIIGSMLQEGLSMPQIYTLMYLYHEGEVRISDVGTLMDVGKAAASQLVERLVQQGLVERVEDVEDRRAKKIKLLPKSREIIERGLAVQQEHMSRVIAHLSPEQLETVQRAFKYLVEAMHQAHSRSLMMSEKE